MTAIDLNLEGDGAWPELATEDYVNGEITHMAVMPNGTTEGRPAIMFRGQTTDGQLVVLQTTWRLLDAVVMGVRARYGPAV